jgi:dihydroorotate dehydrogenase
LRSIKDAIEKLPTRQEKITTLDHPKVIFATGGITNGKQALEVLNAGASVAMVYTALVYGGVGTISRIKNEMREEMNAAKIKNKAKKKTAKS